MSDPRPVIALSSLKLSSSLNSAPSAAGVTFTTLSVSSWAALASLVVTGPVTASSFSGVGTSLTALNASNLASGTLPIARLGISGIQDSTTFFRGDNTWQQVVTAVTVANVNGVSASVSNQGTTPQLSFSLGAITPSSVITTGDVSGYTFIPSGTSAPIKGIFAGSAGSGVSISTSSTERLSISAAGQIQVKGPMVSTIVTPAASAIDCSAGNYFQKTVTGSLTWTFINVPTGVYYAFRLRLINGGKGSQTWPSSVKWPNTGLLGVATAPTLQSSGTDILEFVTDDGGASWRGLQWTTTVG